MNTGGVPEADTDVRKRVGPLTDRRGNIGRFVSLLEAALAEDDP